MKNPICDTCPLVTIIDDITAYKMGWKDYITDLKTLMRWLLYMAKRSK